MDTTPEVPAQQPPEDTQKAPETVDERIKSRRARRRLSSRATRAIATGTALAIAVGTVTGIKAGRSSRPEKRPVPIETIYSSDSIPSNYPFKTDTPRERTQELLTDMADNEVDVYENTVGVFQPGTKFRYYPDPVDLGLPNTAEIVQVKTVPEGFYGVFIRPRRFGLQDKQTYLNVSQIPVDASNDDGRAIELKDNLFIEQTTAEGSAEWFTIDGQPPGPAEGGVNSQGDPTLSHAASRKTAVFMLLNQEQLDALKQKLNMRPEISPPPAG